jgi:hypothetical protein
VGSIRYRQVIKKDGQTVVEEIHKVVVHRFRLGDVEDPDLYAAEPLYKWEKGEPGQFVMKHAIDKPEWHRNIDHVSYSHQYVIVAELEMKKLAEFYLRWGKNGSDSI